MSRDGRPLTRLRHWLHQSGLLTPTAFKVLAFAVVCLIVLAGLAAKIGNISFFTNRVSYSADLSDATGLNASDDVKIAGVTVGQVTGVTLQRAHALVTFAIDPKVHLRSDTQVGTQWHNVLGQQFLYLYPGSHGSVLQPGATLPLKQDVAGADVGALLNSLGPLLGALKPAEANQVVAAFAQALSGDETQVDSLISNAASVSQTVGSEDVQVGQVIDNLNQVFTALSSRSGDLGSVITNLDTVSQSLSSRNALLDQTVTNLGQVAREVATIESSTGGSLSSAINDLQAVSSDIQAHENALSNGLSTLGSGLATYADISSYGQWFEIQTVYTCLADETLCNYDQATNTPAGSGPLGTPPQGASIPAPANGSSPLAALGGGGVPKGASVGDVMQMIAGQGNFLGSSS